MGTGLTISVMGEASLDGVQGLHQLQLIVATEFVGNITNVHVDRRLLRSRSCSQRTRCPHRGDELGTPWDAKNVDSRRTFRLVPTVPTKITPPHLFPVRDTHLSPMPL